MRLLESESKVYVQLEVDKAIIRGFSGFRYLPQVYADVPFHSTLLYRSPQARKRVKLPAIPPPWISPP